MRQSLLAGAGVPSGYLHVHAGADRLRYGLRERRRRPEQLRHVQSRVPYGPDVQRGGLHGCDVLPQRHYVRDQSAVLLGAVHRGRLPARRRVHAPADAVRRVVREYKLGSEQLRYVRSRLHAAGLRLGNVRNFANAKLCRRDQEWKRDGRGLRRRNVPVLRHWQDVQSRSGLRLGRV
jgi:hypothetical protein